MSQTKKLECLFMEGFHKIDDQARRHLVLRKVKLAKLNQLCQYENTDPETFIALIIQYTLCSENIIQNLNRRDIKSLKCAHRYFSRLTMPEGRLPNYKVKYHLHPPYNFESFEVTPTRTTKMQDKIIYDYDFSHPTDKYLFSDETCKLNPPLSLSNWKIKIEKEIEFFENYFSSNIFAKIEIFKNIKRTKEQSQTPETKLENTKTNWLGEVGRSLIKSVKVYKGQSRVSRIDYADFMNCLD